LAEEESNSYLPKNLLSKDISATKCPPADLIKEAFKRGVEIYAFKPILRIDEKSIVVEDEDIPIVFR